MTYPFGIDVSRYQSSQDGTLHFDWNEAKAAGIQFAFVKASEGANYIDPEFARNWSEMQRLSILRGAYHFFRPSHSVSQIQTFFDFVQPQTGERLALDLENHEGLLKQALTEKVRQAVELVKQLSGRYPIIYSRATWLDEHIDMSKLPKLDYWLAQYYYPMPPPLFTKEYPTEQIRIPRGVDRSQIKFHQTAEKGNGKLYGAQSYYIDTNRYIGADELVSYFGGASETQPELPPTSETVLFQARVIADSLIVRDAPNGNATKERKLKGDVVDVLDVSGDWYKLGERRWVSALWVERLDTQPPVELNILNVPALSQRDPRWANLKLGTSGVTIGQQGCLLTCAAMVSKFYGYDTDPAKLNAALLKVGGYYQGNQFVWSALGKIYPLEVADWLDCLWTPAPLHLLDAALKRGAPCIVWVDFNPATANVDMHWVVIVGKLGADDYTMVDPWTGTRGSFKTEYGNPSRYIFRIVSYKRK